jgi:putative pre-16S rRNA nuclease
MGSSSRTTLGLDYGTVRIGLALALPGGGLIVPLDTLANPGEDAAAADLVAEVVRSHSADELVIGDPLHMDGAVSDMSRRVQAFAELVRARVEVPVHLQDERLTSQEAERQFREAGLHWRQVDKGRIDAVAAMGILRDWRQAQADLEPAELSDSSPEPEPEPEPPQSPPSRRDRRRNSRRKRR